MMVYAPSPALQFRRLDVDEPIEVGSRGGARSRPGRTTW
jgi:hypothetical protein